jgi:hypothetical protein
MSGDPQTHQEPASEDEAKKMFGIELAKDHKNAFEAACTAFGPSHTRFALWASQNWINDPVVIASRDLYYKTLELAKPQLDKHQLLAKVLKLAEERNRDNTHYLAAVEDRIKAYKLYAEIAGYVGNKVEINNNNNNITQNNEMKIVFIKPQSSEQIEEIKTINSTANAELPILNDDLKIKLVKTG